jgi:hypothetical protein
MSLNIPSDLEGGGDPGGDGGGMFRRRSLDLLKKMNMCVRDHKLSLDQPFARRQHRDRPPDAHGHGVLVRSDKLTAFAEKIEIS